MPAEAPKRRPAGPPRNVLRGIFRLARFRAEGLADFGDTPGDVLNSLAPLLGFSLVGALLGLAAGSPAAALADFLMTLVALLTPAVLSHTLARRWGREDAWFRYFAAFNWCHWVMLLVFATLAVLLTGFLSTAGMSPDDALAAAEGGWAIYVLAVHWFLARRGLGVSRWRALLLLVVVELGTGAVIYAPLQLAGQFMPEGGVR